MSKFSRFSLIVFALFDILIFSFIIRDISNLEYHRNLALTPSPTLEIPSSTPTATATTTAVFPAVTAIQAESYDVISVQIVPDTPQPSVVEVVPVYQDIVNISEEIDPLPSEMIETEWVSTLVPFPTDSTPTNTMPVFVKTIPEIPERYTSMSLDDAWDNVVAFGLDDKFPQCVYPLSTPFVDWGMAIELGNLQTSDRRYDEIKMNSLDISLIASRGGGNFPDYGIVQISEEQVQSMLLNLYMGNSVGVCKDQNGYPSVYGPGVQVFLDNLSNNYRR